MPAMSPTQIKTFGRLYHLTGLTAATVRSAAAAATVFADAMGAGEMPADLRLVLGYLEHDLEAAVESLADAMASHANVRRICGLPPAEANAAAEAAYMPATDAAELCAS